jgi:hypothetical protein
MDNSASFASPQQRKENANDPSAERKEAVNVDGLNHDLEEPKSNTKYRSLRCPYEGFDDRNNDQIRGAHEQRPRAPSNHSDRQGHILPYRR